MSIHLIKPGSPASNIAMRCGLLATSADDAERIGSEDSFGDIDCVGCLHDFISDLRADGQGLDSPELRWIVGGDTGTSSMTIWAVMTGRPMPHDDQDPDIPHDPSDFGRCYRLLESFPAWRARLAEVADAHPAWAGLVGEWAELEALYRSEHPSGRAPQLYARMKALR
jgi:hypothetical protein